MTELQVSHCWRWHGSTDLPISTGLRAQGGWEWRRGEGRNETSGGGEETDLAAVMEWGFKGEGLMQREEGGDHTEAGWSKAILDLVFVPFSPSCSNKGAEVWAGVKVGVGALLHRRRRWEGNFTAGSYLLKCCSLAPILLKVNFANTPSPVRTHARHCSQLLLEEYGNKLCPDSCTNLFFHSSEVFVLN